MMLSSKFCFATNKNILRSLEYSPSPPSDTDNGFLSPSNKTQNSLSKLESWEQQLEEAAGRNDYYVSPVPSEPEFWIWNVFVCSSSSSQHSQLAEEWVSGGNIHPNSSLQSMRIFDVLLLRISLYGEVR